MTTFTGQTLAALNQQYGLFIDRSVDTGEVDEHLDDQTIRHLIRDHYLRDSSVTIVLVGTETGNRKHVDWKIYSSMYNGTLNKQSGVLAINLPTTGCNYFHAAHGTREKQYLYPSNTIWESITTRSEYERRYPHMPARLIDNLLHDGAKISVANWDTLVEDPERLRFLIETTHSDRHACDYDLSRPMRRANAAGRLS